MKKKIWLFIFIGLINLLVIASFFYFTKKIRNNDNLKVGSTSVR